MTDEPFSTKPTQSPEELSQLQPIGNWILILGIVMVVLGGLAILAPHVTTDAFILMLGVLLIVGACLEFVTAFWTRRARNFLKHMLAGLFYLILGMLMVERTEATAAVFTLVLAMFFLVGGGLRIAFSLAEQFPGWQWSLLNGVITFLLGVLIWRQWPESSFWVIGLFVGIEILFNGFAWIMLGTLLKNLPQPTDSDTDSAQNPTAPENNA